MRKTRTVLLVTGDGQFELSVNPPEISVTQDNKDKVVSFLKTLGTVGVETEDFIDQAKEKYQTYSTGFVEEANEAINEAVEGAVAGAARNFFDNIRQAAGDFFKNLIP